MIIYWNIFWKTFAQLAAAALASAQVYFVTQSNANTVNLSVTGFALVMAFLGALIAVGTAYVKTPATTALQKALRSGVQALVGGVATWAINSVADVVATERLLVPLAVSVVLAFGVTYFQSQGTTTTVTVAP